MNNKNSRAVGLMVVAAGTIGLFFTNGVALGQAPPGSTWKVSARRAERANPVPATSESIARGKKLYIKNCVSCHGKTGVGNGPAAADLKVHPGDLTLPRMNDQTDGALFWKISRGKTPMPTFKAFCPTNSVGILSIMFGRSRLE